MAKKKTPPPLIPHVEGEYLEEVVVLRIPAGTPPAEANKARQWQSNMAKKINVSRKDMWWMEGNKYNRWPKSTT